MWESSPSGGWFHYYYKKTRNDVCHGIKDWTERQGKLWGRIWNINDRIQYFSGNEIYISVTKLIAMKSFCHQLLTSAKSFRTGGLNHIILQTFVCHLKFCKYHKTEIFAKMPEILFVKLVLVIFWMMGFKRPKWLHLSSTKKPSWCPPIIVFILSAMPTPESPIF